MDNSNPSVVQVQLSRGFKAVVDNQDSDLADCKWTAVSNSDQLVYGKRNRQAGGQQPTEYLHRVIMQRILMRKLERNELVDHIDTNTLNNHRNNLRLATRITNARNTRMKRTNRTGYKGVSIDRSGRFTARIRNDEGKRLYLGIFDTPELAHEAYKTAAVKYQGEFANFGVQISEKVQT